MVRKERESWGTVPTFSLAPICIPICDVRTYDDSIPPILEAAKSLHQVGVGIANKS